MWRQTQSSTLIVISLDSTSTQTFCLAEVGILQKSSSMELRDVMRGGNRQQAAPVEVHQLSIPFAQSYATVPCVHISSPIPMQRLRKYMLC